MCDVSKVLDFILFLGDINIFSSHRYLNFIVNTLNEELLNLTDWYRAKKLSINIIKSNFVVFKPRQKREKLNVKLEINQCTIDQFKESMISDVILDGNLSWKPHIASIAMKVSKFISMIHKATLCLPTSVLCTLCYSLVYPHLLYCITAWGSTYPFTLKCFVLLQKKVVEIISRSTFNTRTNPIFIQRKILNLISISNRKGHVFVQDRPSSWCS